MESLAFCASLSAFRFVTEIPGGKGHLDGQYVYELIAAVLLFLDLRYWLTHHFRLIMSAAMLTPELCILQRDIFPVAPLSGESFYKS